MAGSENKLGKLNGWWAKILRKKTIANDDTGNRALTRIAGKPELVGLAAVLAVGLIFRVASFWRYPFCDEYYFLANIQNFFANKTIRVSQFLYPTLFSYLAALGMGVGSIIYWMMGLIPTAHGISYLGIRNPELMLLPGRCVSLAFGFLTIILIYKMGKKLYGEKAGIAAALFLSISPTHIWESGFCVADVCATYMATLAVWFSLNISERGNFRDYFLGGCAVGLSFSTKYNAVLIATAVLTSHFCFLKRERLLIDPKKWINGNLIGSGLAVIISFVMTSPGWITQFPEFVDGFFHQMQVVSQGHMAIGRFGGKFQMAKLYWDGEGTISLLAAFSFLWAAWKHRASDLVIAGAVLPAVLVIGRWYNNMSLHYLLFIFPAVSVWIGRFLAEISGRIVSRQQNFVYWILLLVGIMQPFWADIQNASAERLIDNRWLALEWIHKNIYAGEKIALDWLYTPRISTQKEQEEALRKHPEWNGVFDSIPAYEQISLDKNIGWLFHTDATWLVTSNWDYDRFFLGSPPPEGNPLRKKYFEYRSFYEVLRKGKAGGFEWRLIKSFNQGKGPIIEIYRNPRFLEVR
jgi:hypothetical protein